MVLSEGWTPSRRIRLHRRLAESLEQLYAGQERRACRRAGRAVFRLGHAPGAERGIDHALVASEQADVRFAWERVVSFQEMARDLAARHAPEGAGHPAPVGAGPDAGGGLGPPRIGAQRHRDDARCREDPEAIARFIARSAAALKDNGADSAVWRPLVVQGIDLLGDTRDLTWARLTLLLERFAPITAADHGGPLGRIDADALRIARTEGDEEDYARTLQPFQIRSRAETDALRERIRTWRQPAAINRALMMIGADLMYTHGAFRDAVTFFREMIASARETGSIVTR